MVRSQKYFDSLSDKEKINHITKGLTNILSNTEEWLGLINIYDPLSINNPTNQDYSFYNKLLLKFYNNILSNTIYSNGLKKTKSVIYKHNFKKYYCENGATDTFLYEEMLRLVYQYNDLVLTFPSVSSLMYYELLYFLGLGLISKEEFNTFCVNCYNKEDLLRNVGLIERKVESQNKLFKNRYANSCKEIIISTRKYYDKDLKNMKEHNYLELRRDMPKAYQKFEDNRKKLEAVMYKSLKNNSRNV